MNCPIRPINDYVVIDRFDTDKVSPGGLVLPGGGGPMKRQGRVLAVGPGKKTAQGRIPTDTKPGDIVTWRQQDVHKVFLQPEGTPGQRPLIILRDEQVLAVIE